MRIADIAAAHSPGYQPDTAKLEKALRGKAARIGANALVMRRDRSGAIALLVPAQESQAASACAGN